MLRAGALLRGGSSASTQRRPQHVRRARWCGAAGARRRVSDVRHQRCRFPRRARASTRPRCSRTGASARARSNGSGRMVHWPEPSLSHRGYASRCETRTVTRPRATSWPSGPTAVTSTKVNWRPRSRARGVHDDPVPDRGDVLHAQVDGRHARARDVVVARGDRAVGCGVDQRGEDTAVQRALAVAEALLVARLHRHAVRVPARDAEAAEHVERDPLLPVPAQRRTPLICLHEGLPPSGRRP